MHIKAKKKSFFTLVLSLLFIPQEMPIQAAPTLKEVTLYTAGAAATAYLGYLSLSKPAAFTPTIENLQILSATPKKQDIDSPLPVFQTETPVNSAPPTPRLSTVAKGLMGRRESLEPFIISVKNEQYEVTEGATALSFPGNEPLWIASCGWDPCSGRDLARGINENRRLATRYLGRHIIHGPALFIAHNDARCVFNFGQDTDQKNIDFAYQKAADRDVVLHGLCRGATAILGWMQHYQSDTNVRAIILESPATSLHSACQEVSLKFTHSKIPGALAHRLFSFYYPNYSSEKATQQEETSPLCLAQDVPIFIGNIKGDPISSHASVTALVKKLRKNSKNPIYYFISDESITHAYLNTSKQYQQVVNAFLKKYNLPYDDELASQGEEQLAQALSRAQELGDS